MIVKLLIPFLIVVGCGKSDQRLSYSSTEDFKASGTENVQSSLQLISTSVQNNQTDVSTDSFIILNFSEEVDPSSASSSLALSDVKGLKIDVLILSDAKTVTLKPKAILKAQTPHVFSILESFKTKSGNSVSKRIDINFKTGDIPDRLSPTVNSVFPENNSTIAATNSSITISFSEPIKQSSLANAFVFKNASGSTITGTLIYTDKMATFVPSEVLPAGTYNASLMGSVTDLAGNKLGTDYRWSFTTRNPDTTPPQVSSTSVANGQTNIAVNTGITAIFSEPVDATSIINSNFVLKNGADLVPVTLSASTSNIIVTPLSDLKFSSSYVLTISSVKDLAGNVMATSFAINFSTSAQPDLVPPTVLASNPTSGSTGSINSSSTVTFSEAIDPNSAIASNVQFTQISNGLNIPFSISISGGNILEITPLSALAYNSSYQITVGKIRDLAGNELSNPWSVRFTTSEAPDTTTPTVSRYTPSHNSTGIYVTDSVIIYFSEPVQSSSVSTSNLSMQDSNNNTVPCTVTVDSSGWNATITPSSALLYNSRYSAKVQNVKDLAGNTMTSALQFSFTTVSRPDTTPPSVMSMTPAVGSTNASTSDAIALTFSEDFDWTTITGANIYLSLNGTKVSSTLSNYDKNVTLTPSARLNGNASYIVHVNGVKDLAGNAMTQTFSGTFTTKPTINLSKLPSNPQDNYVGNGSSILVGPDGTIYISNFSGDGSSVNGKLWISKNNGQSFSSAELSIGHIKAIQLDGTILYVLGDTAIAKSINSGDSFSKISIPSSFSKYKFLVKSSLIVILDSNGLQVSSNSGSSFQELNLPGNSYPGPYDFVENGGQIYFSYSSGIRVINTNLSTIKEIPKSLLGIGKLFNKLFVNGNTIMASVFGDGGGYPIYNYHSPVVSLDAGASFASKTVGFSSNQVRQFLISGNSIYVLTSDDAFSISTDNGVNWVNWPASVRDSSFSYYCGNINQFTIANSKIYTSGTSSACSQ